MNFHWRGGTRSPADGRYEAVKLWPPTAACRIALLVPEMVGQLRPKRALDQRLLQLFEKTAISGQVFRPLIVSEQLIQQLRCNRRIGRHVSLLDKVNSQKPPYTVFLTPSITSVTLLPVIG